MTQWVKCLLHENDWGFDPQNPHKIQMGMVAYLNPIMYEAETRNTVSKLASQTT